MARTASTRSKSASLDSSRRDARAGDVAVDRDAAAQQGVGAFTHRRLRRGGRRPASLRPVIARQPRCQEDERARQARDERHDAVDDGGLDALAAPRPAAPKTHAVAPSRGPQPATLGSTMASMASSASGSSSDGGALMPAVRAAMRNVIAWPRTTAADTSAMTSQARRARRPWRTSAATARRSRAQRDRPSARSRTVEDDYGDDRRAAERDRHQGHGRPHGRRQHEQDGDRSAPPAPPARRRAPTPLPATRGRRRARRARG